MSSPILVVVWIYRHKNGITLLKNFSIGLNQERANFLSFAVSVMWRRKAHSPNRSTNGFIGEVVATLAIANTVITT